MNPLRSLLKDTAIYGLSTVVGKFLNWLLTFLYVRILVPEEFGTMTNLYAWVALMLIVLTMGMETTFFRFVNKHPNPDQVYSTALRTLGTTSGLFVLLGVLFTQPLSTFLQLGTESHLLWLLLCIIGLDAFCTIPLAYLRYAQMPWRFLVVRMTFIALTILMTLGVFWILPLLSPSLSVLIKSEYALTCILGINLLGNMVQLLLLSPVIHWHQGGVDWKLLREMLNYAWPILLLGLVGSFNNQADKILFPLLFDDIAEGRHQLGIYSACYKLAVVMVLFTQAFRYAYDPFVFSQTKSNSDSSEKAYALSMRYYVLSTLLIFLGVQSSLEILKLLIAPNYYGGLVVVPWIMAGQLMFGIYFNLSIWYKLTDRTYWGAILSVVGCTLSVIVITLGAERYGFMACAWASVISNATIMVLSYILGQRYYPIDYRIRELLGYIALTVGLLTLEHWGKEWLALNGYTSLIFNLFICILFLGVIYRCEFMPVIKNKRTA